MPCRDEWAERHEIDESLKRLDKVTDMLCRVCRHLEKDEIPPVLFLEPDVKQWWEEHKALDAIRIEEEQAEAQRDLAAKKEQLKRLKAHIAKMEKSGVKKRKR